MFKKYLPYFILLAAGFLLWFVKKHQASSYPKQKNTNTEIVLPAVQPAENFNRNVKNIIYSKHAHCRMDCRHIDETEVKEILATGHINTNKIQEDERGKTYPLEGITHDKQHVRIVFAPKENNTVEVVTCIDLDTDWPCNCK
ncbi:DUF4258 domain-containing protein [Ferruginibacter sp.]|uniref:DUF4258 domain-containing protein n=1 Tax=Ferruginibacter sp. TaxID=1940288 RepID=UPI0019B33A3F|nr:DUF4258 domain-containing protein [Ferruginibacter sp.]MBC7629262.1 DUF4258 domain-containing protein [Ferruginibacter sp.]